MGKISKGAKRHFKQEKREKLKQKKQGGKPANKAHFKRTRDAGGVAPPKRVQGEMAWFSLSSYML